MIVESNRVRMSPSGLSTFTSCPRCWWMEKVGGIKRPRGIFPSLPSGMDRIIKPYYDTFRKTGSLPEEIKAQLPNKNVQLYTDTARLDKFRNWRSGLKFEANKYMLGGALDDLLINLDEAGNIVSYSPFDYKTKGSEPDQAFAEQYYTTQLNCYALLLEKNGMKTDGFGYLLYYYPMSVGQSGLVTFGTKLIQIKTSPGKAEDLCRAAADCCNGPIPAPSAECEYCNHHMGLTKNAAKFAQLNSSTLQPDLPGLTAPEANAHG